MRGSTSALQQCESINRKLAAHIGKYNGIFARLCVVWHCIEHAGGDSLPAVVTEDTARRVAGFLHGFLLPHALAFYAGVLGLSNDHDRLADVAGYILARKLERITNRDVQRGDQRYAQPQAARDRGDVRTARRLRLADKDARPPAVHTRPTGSSTPPSIRSLPSERRRKRSAARGTARRCAELLERPKDNA